MTSITVKYNTCILISLSYRPDCTILYGLIPSYKTSKGKVDAVMIGHQHATKHTQIHYRYLVTYFYSSKMGPAIFFVMIVVSLLIIKIVVPLRRRMSF